MCEFHCLQIELSRQNGADFTRVMQSAGVILLLLIVGFFIILVLSRQRQNRLILTQRMMEKEFMQAKLEIQEEAFTNIGRELHDNVCQILGSARVLIGVTERSLAEPPQTLRKANDAVDDAIHQLRNLSRLMDATWISKFDLNANIQNEISRLRLAFQIQFDVDLQPDPRLSNDRQLILFRVVQEALQNSLKHSSCSNISLKTMVDDDLFMVRIADNGVGFETEKINRGLGVENMTQRTALINGKFTLKSNVDKGTTVQIDIPFT